MLYIKSVVNIMTGKTIDDKTFIMQLYMTVLLRGDLLRSRYVYIYIYMYVYIYIHIYGIIYFI